MPKFLTLAPIYDVITTTVYIKNDIPALKLGDGKLWWKEKNFKTFATKSCGLSNKEYQEILQTCFEAVAKTKQEIEAYKSNDNNVLEFLKNLKHCWCDEIEGHQYPYM